MLEGSFMNNNKQILNYCKNYYKIIDFNFNEEDFITEKLIKIYKKFIFNVDINNTNEVNKVVELDNILNLYIEDYEFRGELQKEIVKVRVKKGSNILVSLIESIIKIFTDYEEYTTKKIYIAKWI